MASGILRKFLVINLLAHPLPKPELSTFRTEGQGYDTIVAEYCVVVEKCDRPIISRWRSCGE